MLRAPRLVVSAPGPWRAIIDPKSNDVNAVAMLVDVTGDLAVGSQRRREDEADLALLQDVGSAIAAGRVLRPPHRRPSVMPNAARVSK